MGGPSRDARVGGRKGPGGVSRAGARGGRSRTALLVLGMHRSGTSAVTGSFGLRGVPLPAHRMAADPHNPRGYFESQHIYAVHEELLRSVGSAWNDPTFLLDRHLPGGRLDPWVERLADVVREEFGDAPLFVLKDPRLCRLLPLWERVLAQIGAEPACLLVVRSPIDVARSLARVHGMALAEGALLWLQHWLRAEADSRTLRRAFLHYDDLLRDWKSELERVVQELGLPLAPLDAEAAAAIEGFLSAGLRHHASAAGEVEAHEGLSTWVKAVYREAVRTRASAPDAEHLDAVRSAFEGAAAAFAPWIARGWKLQGRAQRLAERVREVEERLAAGEAQLAEAERGARRLRERAGALESHTRNLEAERERCASRIGMLEAHAKGLEAELGRAEMRVGGLEEHAGNLERELVQRAERIAALERHLEGIEAELDRRAVRAAELEAHAANLEGERAGREERIAALEGHAANLEAELEGRTQRVGSLEGHVAALESELGRLRRELESLRTTRWFRIAHRLFGSR
jgi:hypothetical protein